MDFSKYLFRSHYVGHIIDVPKILTESQKKTLNAYSERYNGNGNPLTEKQTETYYDLVLKEKNSKKYKLSDTTKKTLTKLATYANHGRENVFYSKPTGKGLRKEKESRELLSEVLGVFLVHDEQRKSNDWVTGKRDIYSDNVIIDIKTSWTYNSFIEHQHAKANEVHLRQGDSYMDLWNIKEFLLCYTLVDTPTDLADSELRKLDYSENFLTMDFGVKEDKMDVFKKTLYNHIYTQQGLEEFCMESNYDINIKMFDDFIEIPKQDRVHMVEHSFNKERIEQRNECIKLAREFMNKVKPYNNITRLKDA